MTSEEFAERFQSHPLGWSFQNLETAETQTLLENVVLMAKGMLFLMEFQKEITKEEYDFLVQALQGNAQRNEKRIEKTNSPGTRTRQ